MIGDTIFAVASPPGAAERGILRISGPGALELAGTLVERDLPRARRTLEEAVAVLGHRLPCLVLVMPGPRSYTGEDVVELHLPGSPLLLETLSARLRGPARDALPGEFTRRAYENGRLDLNEAEAVLALIHAADEEDRAKALEMLEGGVARAVERVRSLVQDALALLESGLDFTEGETGAVAPQSWLPLLRGAGQMLETLESGLPQARVGGELLLLGAASAGKSSLCNALAGREEVLVGDLPGTTRDVLRIEVEGDLVLLDAPGDLEGDHGESVALRDRIAGGCDAALLVVDLTAPRVLRTALPVIAAALTKVDLVVEPPSFDADLAGVPRFAVSSVTGQGLEELRSFLLQRVAAAPSGRSNRLRDVLGRARSALTDAVEKAQGGEPEEGTAVGLGETLALLDEVHGHSTPDDLLDRIFSRFCLGK